MQQNNRLQKFSIKTVSGKIISQYGNIAFASFIIAVISGILLAISYNIKNPYDSVSSMLLTDPAAVLMRNIHNWSAQLFLVFLILHTYDHLKRFTEKRVKSAVWLRLSLSVIAGFFVMLSGFILKGDADSLQAFRIISSLLEKLPYIGKQISYSSLGEIKDFQILYVHHIATSTIFLWIVIVEHARRFWPKFLIVFYLLPLIILAGYILPPGLHDNLSPVIKGPWYFLGLQEAFHWLKTPLVVVAVSAAAFIIFYSLPKLSDKRSLIAKKLLLAMALLYGALIVVGFFFRGENWELTPPWKNPAVINLRFVPFTDISGLASMNVKSSDIPTVLGRREGCLVCHVNMKGFSPSHNPASIGCSSCHSGNPFTLEKRDAHRNLILIPGNLSTARISCGNSSCHPGIIPRVENSIMTTMMGVVSVDKYVFGETSSLSGSERITDLGYSPADIHLRNLCASCHIGAEKTEFGPVSELSRGGGCNSCHLNYSREALESLKSYQSERSGGKEIRSPEFHPDLSSKAADEFCFGCHSRSGRISTSYEGWYETSLTPKQVIGKQGFRILQDGRVFHEITPDIHFEKGMLCIDCHTSAEVMGDGKVYPHKEDQVKISCTDCHRTSFNNLVSLKELDFESGKIASLRNADKKGRVFLYTEKGKVPLINTLAINNKAILIGKDKSDSLELKAPLRVCLESKSHGRLSCSTCHSPWAPQCLNCHTAFNPNAEGFDLLDNAETKGDWIEHPGEMLHDSPVLGTRLVKDLNGNQKRIIGTFVPGMILSIDRSAFSRGAKKEDLFRRFYAPAFSHTIVRTSRSCTSCHNNSAAIGFGRGELTYIKQGSFGKWKFKAKYPHNKFDGLPQDAWVGYLQTKRTDASTRKGARPFTVDEQKKILTVGACLTCHKPDSNVMNNLLLDPGRTFSSVSTKCVLPAWR
ncbi:MAG: DUF4405 domain-containing protein [Syntrophomonadaceae bacterium]